MAKNYIPARDAVFNGWFKFINQYVAGKCEGAAPEWTHIPQDARTEMADAYAAWYTAYSKTLTPHTPADTLVKNNAKKAAIQVIRPFVNQYLRYPPVMPEDRKNMNIPERDTIPTPIPAPEVQAEADLTFPGVHMVELRNIRAVGAPIPDSRSDYGVRIYYGFSGPATEKYRFRITGTPRTGEDLPYSVFTKRKKERFDFDGESGNTVYFCLRYENPTGKPGPFGPMMSAVIP
jgi:hypothetical protein